jgi:hypothetical protein
MDLPLYLALTAAEFKNSSSFPRNLAWMACHFSPYGTGLSNLPPDLPPGSMLILNDRTPIRGHDHNEILCQLNGTNPHLLLLDLQRPMVDAASQLAQQLVEGMNCPVGVSHWYAEDLDCPVFVPPVPPDMAVEDYLSRWKGRNIWLEAALEGIRYTVTEQGSTPSPLPHPPADGLADTRVHCHYKVEEFSDHVDFLLYRTAEDLHTLLEDAKNHGVNCAVGLYQELGKCKL